tara:strand:+ start:459 stop:725 length:267 start_codon:yes stop_codon:yes gene_type:complete
MMTIEFHFSGCRSLKEKRSRLGGFRDRIGKMPSVAVMESDYQDVHDRSIWVLVVLAANTKLSQQLQANIREILLRVDGELIREDIEEF